MSFKLILKGFKLKKLVVKPKNGLTGSTHNSTGRGPGRPLAQPIEGAKNLLFLPKQLFNRSRLNLNRLRSGRGSVEAQRSPAKHLMLTASQPVEPPTASLTFFLYKKALNLHCL